MTTTRTGGEALVHALLSHGIDTIFGLPGVQNDYFYTAVHDARDRMRVIHTRHEQGAAYMALGYAQASGKTGVFVVVPGPGFLNASAALSTAYATNAPVLCLTGQLHSDHIGRGYGMLHEIPDQLGILRSLTKWARRVDSPADVPRLVSEALGAMHSDRPRPVGLEVPLNVFSRKADFDDETLSVARSRPELDRRAVDSAADLLSEALSPAIFIGGGALDAGEEIGRLAEALQAPVIASASGRGILSNRNPYSHSYGPGRRLWEQADVVIAIGTRLSTPMMRWGKPPNLRIIRIDIDPQEHDRHEPPQVSMLADSREALQALLPALAARKRDRPSRRLEMLALHDEMD
ncbi:MAG: thiamine pyrophosphate-binding protein, partial [Caldilineaceae bacterium]|nr:thiamine pyrophosphate-binding protein [Caldilineaceae bacterium]